MWFRWRALACIFTTSPCVFICSPPPPSPPPTPSHPPTTVIYPSFYYLYIEVNLGVWIPLWLIRVYILHRYIVVFPLVYIVALLVQRSCSCLKTSPCNCNVFPDTSCLVMCRRTEAEVSFWMEGCVVCTCNCWLLVDTFVWDGSRSLSHF